MFSVKLAWSHDVSIFAWIEGNQVNTKSLYSSGMPVIDSTVLVYNMSGKKIIEGRTDEQGKFSFQIDENKYLKMVLKEAMGHRAEWIMTPDDLSAEEKDSDHDHSSIHSHNDYDHVNVDQSSHLHEHVDKNSSSQIILSEETLNQIVETALDKKLDPIIQLLMNSKIGKPGITEIIGGIGYIIGLVGMAMIFYSRQKKA